MLKYFIQFALYEEKMFYYTNLINSKFIQREKNSAMIMF